MKLLANLALAAALLITAACAPNTAPATLDEEPAGVSRVAQTTDIADQLAAIDGLDVIEIPEEAPPGYRFFFLTYDQPVDHHNPQGQRFIQQMILLHTSSDAPMVFEPLGYSIYPSIAEPTMLLGANQLTVEHRYYGGSRPQPENWQHLTIKQAAADHHRVVEAFKPLYSGAWVSTGASKGGMTSMYHRRFYPDDVDATIPYVAPHTFGTADYRFATFISNLGDATCRQRIHDYQREVLSRRATIVPLLDMLAAQYGTGFTLIDGGANTALEITIAEFEFTFWQYGAGLSDCAAVPSTDADDFTLLMALMNSGAVFTDIGLSVYQPYFYQSMTQLGYPAVDVSHIADLLTVDTSDLSLLTAGMPQPSFDWWAMIDVALWALFDAESVLYIYGENDPWTAGAFPLSLKKANDTHRFDAPEGNHSAGILDLAPADRDAAVTILEGWTGVDITIPAPANASAPANIAPAQRLTWTERPVLSLVDRPAL